MEKEMTGGTAELKSEDVCRIVPSPPSVITRSVTRVYSTRLPSDMNAVRDLSHKEVGNVTYEKDVDQNIERTWNDIYKW